MTDMNEYNPPNDNVQAQTLVFSKYITLSEAAEILGCHYETVRQMVLKSQLPVTRFVGGLMRIPAAAFYKILEENTCGAESTPQSSENIPTDQTGTSKMDGKSIARALRVRRKPDAS